jgi:hypothetical protein
MVGLLGLCVEGEAVQLEEDVDRLRQELRAYFRAIPEPPLYRRREDPAVKAAARSLEAGRVLLERAPGAELGKLREALEAHLVALSLLAENKVEAAEGAWREALALERAATAELRLWKRTDEVQRPVFDRALGVSRFDPREAALVQVSLACPLCRKVVGFRLPHRRATHELRCPSCKRPFVAYLGELKAVQTSLKGRTRHSIFRVVEPSGAQTRVEIDDATGHELPVAQRDLLAFLYGPPERLRGVLNLDTGKVLWLNTTGPCFVATVAFGPGAPELVTLRRFRDEVLLRGRAGQRFVRWYYARGPALAVFVERRPWRKRVTRGLLSLIVRGLDVR